MKNIRPCACAIAALGLSATGLAGPGFLLIPDSTADSVGMYDPMNGAHLGDFIAPDPSVFNLPFNAVQGPDGLIYISDQNNDRVVRYDFAGTFVDVFADAADGLDNVRGIDFMGTDLLVSHSPSGTVNDGVARFNSAGTRLADFITGVDPFDVHVTASGRVLVSDLGGTDGVRLYDNFGVLDSTIFSVAFPEQINDRSNGNFVNISFTGSVVTEFDFVGPINTVPTPGGSDGRGVWELGNGNLLVTLSSGVHEINPNTGALINTIRTGAGFRYIEFVIPAPGAGALLSVGALAALRRRR